MGSFSSKKFDPATDLLDLTGKVAMVTGGNSGIGYATIKYLARRGAKVYMAARNESKATGAMTSLETEGLGTGSVVWLKLDLLDPREVKKAAEEFLSREDRLDILVNNAAKSITNSIPKTNDGISESMATNHFGPFVFTQTLLPLLIETSRKPDSDVRIVNVTSKVHTSVPDVRFRGLEDFNLEFQDSIWPGMTRYGYSKMTSILFSAELQRRLDLESVPIIVTSVHPGTVNTFAHRLPFPRFAHWVFSFLAVTPDEGSWTSLIAAASPILRDDPAKYKGAYLMPVGQVKAPSKQAGDPELAKELWASTEAFLREFKI